MSQSPSQLTELERLALRALAFNYEAAHAAKDYDASDAFRAELMAWGAWPPEHGWHPVSESPEHRKARLARR